MANPASMQMRAPRSAADVECELTIHRSMFIVHTKLFQGWSKVPTSSSTKEMNKDLQGKTSGLSKRTFVIHTFSELWSPEFHRRGNYDGQETRPAFWWQHMRNHLWNKWLGAHSVPDSSQGSDRNILSLCSLRPCWADLQRTSGQTQYELMSW